MRRKYLWALLPLLALPAMFYPLGAGVLVDGKQLFEDVRARVEGGGGATDPWSLTHGGFRADWEASARDRVTAQGDAFVSETDQVTGRPDSVEFNSQFLQLRWNRGFSETADLQEGGSFEVSVYGRNLGQAGHPEFIVADAGVVAEIPRSVGGKVAWRI